MMCEVAARVVVMKWEGLVPALLLRAVCPANSFNGLEAPNGHV